MHLKFLFGIFFSIKEIYIMAISDSAKNYVDKAFGGQWRELAETDPEFYEFFTNFAYGEVLDFCKLEGKIAHISVLAVLLGCGGVDEFRVMLPAALNCGVTPEEAREVVYQAVAYLGIGRVLPFISLMNDIFSSRGINLPLGKQGTTTADSRLSAGNGVQIDIFGEGMREFWKGAPEGRAHINYWLADNCFGDYYTRGALDNKQRELITFCYLYAQGGCEPQLISHAMGNIKAGNSRETLYAVVSLCIPYIGYPRSLNALSAIDAAVKNLGQQ